jgi:hypothetical protein
MRDDEEKRDETRKEEQPQKEAKLPLLLPLLGVSVSYL